jgi:hypothetical protein
MIAKGSGKCDFHLIDTFNFFLFHFLPFPSQLPKMLLFYFLWCMYLLVCQEASVFYEIKGLENSRKFYDHLSQKKARHTWLPFLLSALTKHSYFYCSDQPCGKPCKPCQEDVQNIKNLPCIER